MPELPNKNLTVEAIYEHYKQEGSRNARYSNGIGISTAGEPCTRKLWYAFRWFLAPITFDGRMYRLFDTGKLEEPRMAADLKAIGCEVYIENESGQQFRVQDLGGHISGYIDGVALGIPEAPKTWHLLEFKTHSAKSFTEVVKKGVEAAQPKHFVQCMLGMGLAEPKLDRALYLAKNKDTDELYAERIRFDKTKFEELIGKLKKVILDDQVPPARIADNADSWSCKFCEYRVACHKLTPVLPVVNCRTCLHSTPQVDGSWHCEKHGNNIDRLVQLKGCSKHLFIPQIMPYELIDADENRLTYKTIDGKELFNHEGGVIDDIPF